MTLASTQKCAHIQKAQAHVHIHVYTHTHGKKEVKDEKKKGRPRNLRKV